MSIFDRRLKHVTTRIWDATASSFKFPELGDPALQLPEIASRPNAGIAFSGGGTRAAAAAVGQLRGLHALGVLTKARYISCVSGGSWACVPFTYLPTQWTDDAFLGQHLDPEAITAKALAETDRNSFAHQVANSVIIDDFLANAVLLAGDETYSRAVGQIFLDTFELDSASRFFTQDRRSLGQILARNPNAREEDFQLVRPGRPFLIVNSTLLRTDNDPPKAQLIHFETTPLYAGVHVRHRGAGSNGRAIGGGYVEPFGFDSDAPERAPSAQKTVRVRLGAKRHRYALSDVIGTSGAAPAETLVRIGLDFLGFPEFKHWPIRAPHRAVAREYEFGDGGHLENIGIMPLLMRKVARIIAFVNSKTPLRGGGEDEINQTLRTLFGQTPGFSLNHVFPASRYQRLANGLLAAQTANEPVTFRDTYRVRANRHYGIDSGWDVDVLWVYNARVKNWESRLRPAIKEAIGVGSLGTFPHYRTFFQNPPAVIDLSAKQVNLLGHLSCWNVLERRQEIEAMMT